MSAETNPVDLLIDDHYLAASRAATLHVRGLAVRVLSALGLWRLPQQSPLPASDLAAAGGVDPAAAGAFEWLLEEAARAGLVGSVEDGEVLYRLLRAPAEDELAPPLDPGPYAGFMGSSLPMFAYIEERYAAHLRGERSGAGILLKPPGLRLWEEYFSSANPLYEVHNQLGWTGVRQALRRLARPCRVLELGAGTGGGTAAVLRGLAAEEGAPAVHLTISDVTPSFLIGTLERLAPLASPGVRLERRRLDFVRPLTDQGIEPGSVDVLVGTNALHNGGDLAQALAALRPVLAPDGSLVVSESLCGPGEHVHQEVVFNLLPLARRPGQDRRTRSRFFSAEEWREALAAAGFAGSAWSNDRGPQLALLAVAHPSPA